MLYFVRKEKSLFWLLLLLLLLNVINTVVQYNQGLSLNCIVNMDSRAVELKRLNEEKEVLLIQLKKVNERIEYVKKQLFYNAKKN